MNSPVEREFGIITAVRDQRSTEGGGDPINLAGKELDYCRLQGISMASVSIRATASAQREARADDKPLGLVPTRDNIQGLSEGSNTGASKNCLVVLEKLTCTIPILNCV